MARGQPDTDPTIVLSIFGLGIAGMATTSPLYRKAAFTALTSLIVYTILFTSTTNRGNDNALGSFIGGFFFRMSDFLLLCNPQQTLRLKGDSARNISKEPLADRLKWAFALFTAFRGVGWEHEPTSHIAPPMKASRTWFMARRLATAVFGVLLCAMSDELFTIMYNAYEQHGTGWADSSLLARFASYGLLMRVYGPAQLGYALLSIIAVAAGWTGMDAWPDLFGSFADAYTIRRFWGRVWHQVFRKFLTAHAHKFADTLDLQKGRLRNYFVLYVAFFLSGCVHYCGNYMAQQSWAGDEIKFFVMQAIAITFEDTVVGLVKRSGVQVPTPIAKTIGFAWTAGWFAYSFPIWVGPHLALKVWEPSF